MPTIPLALLGTGNMGAAMAARLLDLGFRVTVHNRTAERTAGLAAAGASVAPTAAAAAAGAAVVLVSLSDDAAVEHVVFGELEGALTPGQFLVDTSTLSPGYARSSDRRLSVAGVRRVEACVVGNPHQARHGYLRVFAGGSADDVDAVREVLAALGHQVVHVGGAGQGCVVKLVFNLLLGAQIASLAEAVGYGTAAGLDRDWLLSVIASSGFSSKVMAFRAEVMRERQYEPPGFRADLMLKDLRVALDDAVDVGVRPSVLGEVRNLYAAVVASGDGARDAAVVAETQWAAPADDVAAGAPP